MTSNASESTTLTGSAPELGIERITAVLASGAGCFDRKAGDLTLFFAKPTPSIVQDQPARTNDAGECEWLEKTKTTSVLLSRHLHAAEYEGFWVHLVGEDLTLRGTLRITCGGGERADEDDDKRSAELERARWLAVARSAWLRTEWVRETESAIAALKQAAEQLPKSGWVQLQCGRALGEQAGDHEAAAVHLDRAESAGTQSEDMTTRADRGRVSLALGRPDDALSLADEALATVSDHRALWVRAAALVMLDRLPEAVDASAASLAAAPPSANKPLEAYRNSAHRVRGQLEHGNGWVARALVAAELGRADDAVGGLRARLVELVGEDLATKHFARIERLWTEVAERPPCKSSAEFSKCVHAVADALQQLTQHEAAVAVYRGIADGPSAIGEGKSLEALGRRDEAKAAFEKADAAGHRDAKMLLSQFQARPPMNRVQRSAAVLDDAVDIGDIVMHKKYGRGVVVDVEDGTQTKVMVEFDGGEERTLLPKFISVVERAT